MAGMAGFTIRLGLSELGPLPVLINVEVPGGILLEPITGLTINDFPPASSSSRRCRRSTTRSRCATRSSSCRRRSASPTGSTSLQQQVARQAKTLHDNPGQSGFAAAFTSPMMITGSREDLLDLHVAGGLQRPGDRQDLDRRQVPDRRQAELRGTTRSRSAAGSTPTSRKISSGNVTVLFLADIPDQVRLLTIYGKLKMGFRTPSGEEVDVRRRRRTRRRRPRARRRRPRTSSTRRASGGSVDINVVTGVAANPTTRRAALPRRRLPGADRRVARLRLDPQHEHALHGHRRGDRRRAARRSARGRRRWRRCRSTTASRSSRSRSTRRRRPCGAGARAARSTATRRRPSSTPASQRVASAAARGRQRPGRGVGRRSRRCRRRPRSRARPSRRQRTYRRAPPRPRTPARGRGARRPARTASATTSAPSHWALGDVTVSFAADAFKNANVTLADGTVDDRRVERRVHADVHRPGRDGAARRPGRGRRRSTSTSSTTATGSTWSSSRRRGLKIDAGSITDLEPEFTLTGPGIGSIVLDAARAPSLVMGDPGVAGATLTYRYWLTGRFAPTGDVTLTYLANTGRSTSRRSRPCSAVTIGPQYLDVVFPDPGAHGYVIVAATVGDHLASAPEITLRLLDPATNHVTHRRPAGRSRSTRRRRSCSSTRTSSATSSTSRSTRPWRRRSRR